MSCTTKNMILNHLAQDKEFIRTIKTKIKKHYAEDILQDILLYVHSKYDEEKLLFLNQKNQLIYFIYGILWRQTHSKKNNTYKLYGRGFGSAELTFDPSTNEDDSCQLYDTKDIEMIIHEATKDLDWYTKEIFEIYLYSGKSFRKLEQELNISDTSLANTVKKCKIAIKEYVLNEYNK